MHPPIRMVSYVQESRSRLPAKRETHQTRIENARIDREPSAVELVLEPLPPAVQICRDAALVKMGLKLHAHGWD